MLTLDKLKELTRAADPTAGGREEAWLAAKIGGTIQTVHNWGARAGVPCGNWVKLADALGCSVDELLGRSPPAWPFERVGYAEWQELTERERGGVERAMLDELAAIRATSGKRAAGAG